MILLTLRGVNCSAYTISTHNFWSYVLLTAETIVIILLIASKTEYHSVSLNVKETERDTDMSEKIENTYELRPLIEQIPEDWRYRIDEIAERYKKLYYGPRADRLRFRSARRRRGRRPRRRPPALLRRGPGARRRPAARPGRTRLLHGRHRRRPVRTGRCGRGLRHPRPL